MSVALSLIGGTALAATVIAAVPQLRNRAVEWYQDNYPAAGAAAGRRAAPAAVAVGRGGAAPAAGAGAGAAAGAPAVRTAAEAQQDVDTIVQETLKIFTAPRARIPRTSNTEELRRGYIIRQVTGEARAAAETPANRAAGLNVDVQVARADAYAQAMLAHPDRRTAMRRANVAAALDAADAAQVRLAKVAIEDRCVTTLTAGIDALGAQDKADLHNPINPQRQRIETDLLATVRREAETQRNLLPAARRDQIDVDTAVARAQSYTRAIFTGSTPAEAGVIADSQIAPNHPRTRNLEIANRAGQRAHRAALAAGRPAPEAATAQANARAAILQDWVMGPDGHYVQVGQEQPDGSYITRNTAGRTERTDNTAAAIRSYRTGSRVVQLLSIGAAALVVTGFFASAIILWPLAAAIGFGILVWFATNAGTAGVSGSEHLKTAGRVLFAPLRLVLAVVGTLGALASMAFGGTAIGCLSCVAGRDATPDNWKAITLDTFFGAPIPLTRPRAAAAARPAALVVAPALAGGAGA